MVFRNIILSHLSALSLQQALDLCNIYLENAYTTADRDISLVLCHEAKVALSQAKSADKKYSTHFKNTGYQSLRDGVATAYIDLGKLLEKQGYLDEAQTIYKKAEKWGRGNSRDPGRLARSLNLAGAVQKVQSTSASVGGSQIIGLMHDVAKFPAYIFPDDILLPTIDFKLLPEPEGRLNSTRQLVCCLGLLQDYRSTDDALDVSARNWLQAFEKDADEQERLHTMATEVIRAFKRNEIKDAKAVAEVVCLAPVLNKDSFHDLLREFYSGVDQSGLLNFYQLEGLAQLIQDADPGHLSADDLVKILELVSTRLRNTHQQSTHHMHRLTLAVSHVLDAMAETKVTGLDREKLHEPLSTYLDELRRSKDTYLVYQASYGYQALLCVPDDETTWQAAMRRTGKVVQGVSGLVSAAKNLDLVKFVEGLQNIQKGFAGASKVVGAIKTAYDGVTSLVQSGEGFAGCLHEGLSFKHKRDWYSALRGADIMIRNGELAMFRKLVCGAPCRYDAAFQWGVCQRLGEIAANPMWDLDSRRGAVAFLGEIYKDDDVWGQHARIKQWILNILMQLATSTTGVLQLHVTVAESLLQELEVYGDAKKQDLYRECRKNGPIPYPLKVTPLEITSPSLLDRAQNRPDVEGTLRLLRKQRTKERGNAVYVQPQAKADFQADDEARFPLKEKVQEFLLSNRKVFLLLGDSGAGKSTFSRELEHELWQTYKSKNGRIPLHINLPSIDKPEHDMIAKQLRKVEFTEPQIREMKHHRQFILICDGYDESQQTHNLYMSNQLNQSGEWDAQMVISCRSEYLGSDYRDRFQPGDRNKRSDPSLFQEAVITPFTLDQVQAYIKQYVSLHQPLWRVSDYEDALDLIPSLRDLVKNPFLMTLSLEVLPRMMDPGQHLSTTRVTRVTLYDHFIEQWLERGKKRLRDKDLTPQAKAAFERLSSEGFTRNGIEYLKRLAVAIYKEQDGHPVVEYSQLIDEGSWKEAFFNQDHKQILLEASPITRTGNQHRFIHRSLLEYGLTRAIFDPQDRRNLSITVAVPNERSRMSSTVDYGSEGSDEELANQYEPDLKSPLVWRNFMNDYSLLHFLEERVQQEPVFKEQLLAFIKHSRRDPKWSKAAANAITIMVRAGALNEDLFHDLFKEFCSGIDYSDILNIHQLEGLAHLIQGAGPGHLKAADLIKILELLGTRLSDARQHSHHLALAVSHILDAVADTRVTDLDHEKLQEPLSAYLRRMKGSQDPYMVYQAAYSYQALLCIQDDETTWQAAMGHSGKSIQNVSGTAGAVKSLDFTKLIQGLQDIRKGSAEASNSVGSVENAYERVITLDQSGKSFGECLQNGLSFELKRDWYSALRGADTLILKGDIATFRKLVCEAPCRIDAAFQWGVCQRLGEIAVKPTWDASTRRRSIEFLGEIYRDDETWGQQANIKQWILNILMQLATSSENALELYATVSESLLEELKVCGDAKKQDLYRMCQEKGPVAYPLKVILPEFASSFMLNRVQNRPDVERSLRKLRKQRTMDRGESVYVQPQAKASLQASDDARFPLRERIQEFLESEQKVFLLLGDSGAGKSTFSRELEFDLWRSYNGKTGQIPLHIDLPTIEKPEHDMIDKQLRKFEFTDLQILEMKNNRQLILICDGYDESQQKNNLYVSNRFNQPGEWSARMIISCRSEYLGTDYRDRFQPGDRNQRSDSSLFQEAVITPFSLDQVEGYIEQYLSAHQTSWRARDYERALSLIPSLRELVKNPFMMTLSLEVLPRMADPGNLSTTSITRVVLYDHFIEQWLERNKKRLEEKDMTPQARAAFESLSAEGFTLNGIEYLKRLAVAIYKEQDGHPVVEYSQLNDEGTWKVAFFNQEHARLLLEASPLIRKGNQHRFIHRSFLEYGLARAIFDPQEKRNKAVSNPVLGRRGSVGSIFSFETEEGSERMAFPEEEPNFDSPLVWKSFMNDYSLMQFLEERVLQEPLFKRRLLDYIECSKADKKWRKAAANAITILVRAGEQFVGADLRGIQIPGADLSYGMFDSVQLQDADLRKVNFRGIWFRQTDMSRAQMAGTQFGELPFLSEDNQVYSCAFSPDKDYLAVGLGNGDLSIYTTSGWEKIMTLAGHTGPIRCVVYSPRGDQVASCGSDITVRLWDPKTGSLQHTLTDHTDWVRCIAYSPEENLVASASDDKTIRLWNTDTGDCSRLLSGHANGVQCIAYSPNSKQIVSGSSDRTVRLWSIKKGRCKHILSGHRNAVRAIGYSPRWDQVASASEDKTVRLWDMGTRECIRILSGHINIVRSVTFSPKGDQLASGGEDATVRLWDVETGLCHHTLKGHGNTVMSVVYSPDGNQIASGGYDRTVRLWDVSAGVTRIVASGHIMGVNTIKCSPSGKLIASGSSDTTIRLWDADTRACHRIMSGHEGWVSSVAFSPQGNRIVSGSADRTVRLWDVETGECLHVLTGHDGRVECVAYSPQGNMIASASDDKTVMLWDLETGECRRTLKGHTDRVLCVAYSPDGTHIATGSMDKTARIWDAETGRPCQTLKGHSYWVQDVVFSPQGCELASAGYDNMIRLWNVETQECRVTLTGHCDKVRSIAYSHEGDLLASGSLDKTVRLWDAASGECRSVIQNITGAVNTIGWNATSYADFLVTGNGDGSVLKWEVMNGEDLCHVRLGWHITNGTLDVTGASIQDAQGLSRVNKQLLKQRGAIGEPENLFRASRNKLITMATVMSKVKQPWDDIVTNPME